MFNIQMKLDIMKVKKDFKNIPSDVMDRVNWIYKKPTRMLKTVIKDGKRTFSIHQLVISGHRTIDKGFWVYTTYELCDNDEVKQIRSGKYPASWN